MFRRFRRFKEKQPLVPVQPPVMLPPPTYIPNHLPNHLPNHSPEQNAVFADATPTVPLRAVRPGQDDWLVNEYGNTQQDTSFGRKSQPRRQSGAIAVDPIIVASLLEQFVNAPTWDDSRQLVKNHSELLSNTALMLLRTNVNRVAEQVGPAAAQTLSRYLQTLEVAQREGVDFAFDRTASPQEKLFAPDLEELLARLESPQAAKNLSERITLCEEALQLAARDQNDELWAALQREMGLTLPRLRYGDHSLHVERAIEALDAALQIFTRIEFPTDWAMTQHYLGIALLERISDDRAGDIDQAIESFEAALQVRTRETLPKEWATTQEAVGSAYFHRINGTHAENIDRSIAAFEAALQVRSQERTPFEWATDQLSLGNAYGQRSTGTRRGNIEQAITGFEAALTYFTQDNAPDQWALIHHNLGVAYMDRILGNRGDNVEHAIDHYQLAMTVQTRERAPLDWADTRNNLGNAYRERVAGVHSENIRAALTCYQESLQIRTRDAFPAEHRRTARNLGALLFELGQWDYAHDIMAGAITASDALYALRLGEQGPNQRLREHAELVALDAYCLTKINRPRDAVQRMEQGRSRALDEVLERDRFALNALPAQVRLSFERAQSRLLASYQAAQRIVAAGGTLNNDAQNLRLDNDRTPGMRRTLDDMAVERREAQSKFDAIVATIRKQRADFLHPTISFKQIASAAVAKQAIVYLATTAQGTLALIVPGSTTEMTNDHCLWIQDLTTALLEDRLTNADENEHVLKTQLGTLPSPNTLSDVLQLLGSRLMEPLAVRLQQLNMQSVVLIPSGRLATVPLHAAPIGNLPAPLATEMSAKNRSEPLFMDAFEVAYIPSAQRLLTARAGSMISLRSGVAAVGNPQPASVSLEWAEHEAEAIAQVTNRSDQSCTLLIRRQATGEAVKKVIKDRAYIHLACASGFYPDRPAESYLELAGGDTLRVAEVLGNTLSLRGVRLLVLSTGQSAYSNAIAPDEGISMAAAMLVGGATAVAASILPASDLATLLLMRRFAANYLNGDEKPPQALNNAQRWLRSLTLAEMTKDFTADLGRDPDLNLADISKPDECPFAHPIYWSGFMLYGV